MATIILGDIVEVIKETVHNPQESGFQYFVGLEHYDSGEPLITRYATPDNLTSSVKHFAKGDILVARRNVYLKRASLVDFEGVTSGDSIVLRAKDKKYQRILPFILNSDDFWDYAEQNSDGTMSKRLSPADLLDYEFEEPENKEVLADKLWAAYRVKESYKKLLAATDDMLKAKFMEMFGDIFENTRNWKEYGPFPKYTEILLGSTPKSSEPSFWNGDVLWITPAEMLDEIVVYSDTARHITKEGAKNAHLSILPKGTVLFSTRAPIGKVGIVGQEMYCNQGFKNFHCGEMLNEYFLYYSLLQKREYFQGLGTGSTFKELSKSTIEKICIAVPPLKLQCDFAKIFTQAEATKESLRKSIENIDQVIKSLINQ